MLQIGRLFVELVGLSQALLLGTLLGNLVDVLRLGRAGSGDVRGNLRLDGVNGAAALVLLDGLQWRHQ